MIQVQSMAMKVFFSVFALFTVGLRANGKVIPNDVNVCENDIAVLPCRDASNLRYRWKIGNSQGRQKIPDTPNKYAFNNSSLIIKNVQPKDTASRYYCHTYSSGSNRITYVYTLKIICQDITANVGHKLALKCNVDIADGDIQKIEWKFRSKQLKKTIKLNSNQRIAMSGKMLTIGDVQMGDSGTFVCIAHRKIDVHLSKGRYFYNLLVEKAAETTTTAPQTTTMLPTTAPVSRQTTTQLPPFPNVPTTTEIPVTKPETTQNPTSATMPVTKQGMTPSQTTRAAPSTTKQPNLTEEPLLVNTEKTLPNEHSTQSTIEKMKTEILTRTLNPKHRVRTTQSNAIDSGNDNQIADKMLTTQHSAAGTVAVSISAVVGFCAIALLLFYMT